jgi:hypothetical protein
VRLFIQAKGGHVSFEGYYQLVCENNHYFTIDVYSWDFNKRKCIYCESEIIAKNLVDETNCDSDGYDPDLMTGRNYPVSVWKEDLNLLVSLLKDSKVLLQDFLNGENLNRFQIEELLEKIYKAEETGDQNGNL